MKLIIYSKTEQGMERSEYIADSIDWWDQRYIGNGIWLHIYNKDDEFSIEFDIEKDTFLILK